jgi:hypothetical protein
MTYTLSDRSADTGTRAALTARLYRVIADRVDHGAPAPTWVHAGVGAAMLSFRDAGHVLHPAWAEAFGLRHHAVDCRELPERGMRVTTHIWRGRLGPLPVEVSVSCSAPLDTPGSAELVEARGALAGAR